MQAQGVKVSPVPGTPDTSAGFELDFSDRGFLAPRMTEAQRIAIPLPAKALLVYQTDGSKPGFYFNYGTAAIPDWRRLVTEEDLLSASPCGSSNLDYDIEANVDTILLVPGNSNSDLEITFHYNSGTITNVELDVAGTPAGMIYDIDFTGNIFPSKATLIFHASLTNAVPGNYPLTITANCGVTPQVVTVILSIPQTKRIFVSSTSHAGDLGGLAGADQICQNLADAQSLGGTWKAWLATDRQNDPNTRFNKAADPYLLVDGTIIALNFDDLGDYYNSVQNFLLNPINLDEQGNVVADDTPVWTNSYASGVGFVTASVASSTCNGWTSTTNDGHKGNIGYLWRVWTSNNFRPCNQPSRLYCFEQ